jgi:cyclophilin family peptidyl-prolyl cis-trans isomerase
MHAARYLSELSDRNEARKLFRYAIENGDVSVISGIAELLDNPEIVRDQDFSMIQKIYNRWVDEDETDKISELNSGLKQRFPNQFEPTEVGPRPFLYPDWERLKQLGSRPHWFLETSEGEIVIGLHTEKAPFTVSSIDSLTRAGHYNGTVIHRVVPIFVIQGGDFTRRDGYGSPGYRIPTEPSFDSFERGKVGIASSGQDTEGGQFFIMHQWAPHLDGNYTIFGEVIRGMEVVDRLQVGDVLLVSELVKGY